MEQKLSYEQALARLEQIIRAMESDKIPLEDSLRMYEEGVAIVRRLSAELDEAERKIKILQQNAQGEIVAVDFITDDAEE
ncbi:MAG: exodeoxyribonuclease VII small subunit [Ruminococcaceae bacterium]|nr:exodeoxyribonuclease VII small subunit [Oscillospiraceae bacterium]